MSTFSLKKINWKKEPFYNSFWVEKFFNTLIKKGSKIKIEKKFYNIVSSFKIRHCNFLLMFFYALELTKPIVELKKYVKKNKIIRIPHQLLPRKQYTLALHWISVSINEIPNISVESKITNLFSNLCFFFKSSILKKKQQHYDLVKQNRMQVRYRW